MTRQHSVRINMTGLDDLRKALAAGGYVKVGVLGNEKKERKEGHIDNVELGIVHELGSYKNNIPARSFLRMPMEEKRREIAKFMGSKKIKGLLVEGKIENALELIGVYAEAWIQSAFASRGFGKWKPITKQTAARKGTTAILIQSTQLRKSVSSEVVVP